MADTELNIINLAPPNGFFASLDGLILDVQNGDLGDADTSYTYVDNVKAGFNTFALQFAIAETTLTIEGSNDLPSVANASANWTNITDVLTSGAAASFTVTGSLSLLLPIPFSRLRIKRVTTDATNSLQLYLTRMRIK